MQLPGQQYPEHFHKLKDETFQVLHVRAYSSGWQTQHSRTGANMSGATGHLAQFLDETGAVFEEISTRDVLGDSTTVTKRSIGWNEANVKQSLITGGDPNTRSARWCRR